jgi:hypothetical protein
MLFIIRPPDKDKTEAAAQMTNDQHGLNMDGLSRTQEALCRKIHKDFLREHGQAACPVKITSRTLTPVYGHDQAYQVAIECGHGSRATVEAVSSDVTSLLTANFADALEKSAPDHVVQPI